MDSFKTVVSALLEKKPHQITVMRWMLAILKNSFRKKFY